MIGETVGNFKIVSKLSIGGMGTVYKAEHTLIGKVAAVKILHPELSSNREIVNRFFNEAKATTTIKHPGIVEIFDYGIMKSGNAKVAVKPKAEPAPKKDPPIEIKKPPVNTLPIERDIE